MTVKGTVTKMEWVNPHVWLHMDVKKPDGKVENWAFEAGTPNVLFRRGFTRKSLLPGTVVVIDGYRAKDGSRRANGRDLTFEDGTKLFMGSSGTGAPYELNQKPGSLSQNRGAARPRGSAHSSSRATARAGPALLAGARVQRGRRAIGNRSLAATKDDGVVGQRGRRPLERRVSVRRTRRIAAGGHESEPASPLERGGHPCQIRWRLAR